jgi:hypothetical protein
VHAYYICMHNQMKPSETARLNRLSTRQGRCVPDKELFPRDSAMVCLKGRLVPSTWPAAISTITTTLHDHVHNHVHTTTLQ